MIDQFNSYILETISDRVSDRVRRSWAAAEERDQENREKILI
jgi:hypothetical protein